MCQVFSFAVTVIKSDKIKVVNNTGTSSILNKTQKLPTVNQLTAWHMIRRCQRLGVTVGMVMYVLHFPRCLRDFFGKFF
jgi:hypothetical protein